MHWTHLTLLTFAALLCNHQVSGDCLEGWTDAAALNLGCLYFHDEVPQSSAHGRFLCDSLGTKTDTAGGTGDAVVQVVEVTNEEGAKDLASLVDAKPAEKDKPHWIGASYVPAKSDFTWYSDQTAAMDPAANYPDTFIPDDIDPPPIIDNALCVSMTLDGQTPVWDDVSCWEGGKNLICQCIDKCPASEVTPAPTPGSTDCTGDGWTYVTDLGCIKILIDAVGLTYNDAESACNDVGGNLVELETTAQIEALEKQEILFQIINKDIENFWLGMQEWLPNYWLNHITEEQVPDNSIFPWYDASSGGGIEQPDETPATIQAKNCIVGTLNADQKGWHDVKCDGVTELLGQGIAPICLENRSLVSTTSEPEGPTDPNDTTDPNGTTDDTETNEPGQTTDANGSTPSDGTTAPNETTEQNETTAPNDVIFPPECLYMDADYNTCYIYHNDKLGWSGAEAACVQKGGHLPSVLSQQENDFIRFFVMDQFPIWIGAKGSGASGFTWSDGNTWDFENWRQGYPGTNSDELCVFLSAATGEWSSYDCAYPIKYICKLVK